MSTDDPNPHADQENSNLLMRTDAMCRKTTRSATTTVSQETRSVQYKHNSKHSRKQTTDATQCNAQTMTNKTRKQTTDTTNGQSCEQQTTKGNPAARATNDNKAAPFKGTLPAWQHPTTAAPASSNVLVGWVQPALPNNAPSFWPRNKIHMLRSAA